MENDNVRILVIGAGVNGSVCATHLRDHGVDVTVLARGECLECAGVSAMASQTLV